MPNPNAEHDAPSNGTYRTIAFPAADGGLVLRASAALSEGWIAHALSRVGSGDGRQHGRADLPNGGQAFIKIYNPRAKHSLLRRLRSSRAIAEGRGYLAFAAAGIETPELLAWGEVRRRGLWMRGVVITRLIDGPTVAEDYLARRNARTVDRAAESLARIHRAGLAHGDPRLRNFLVSGETILAFDLCSWGRLSERRRREDLVKFLGSTMTITEHAAAERWLETYAAASAWKCVNAEQLMLHAAAYAKKERVP